MMPPKIPLPNFEHCDAFWARQETDRPLLSGWAGTFEIPQLYQSGLAQLPEGTLNPEDIKFEYFRDDYEKLFEDQKKIAADIPWAAFPLMGMPWVEAVFGCPIQHRDHQIWSEPWLDSYTRLEEEGLKLRQDWLEHLDGFTRWLVELSNERFPVALCLMRGPTDVLAAMRGATQSIHDLYEHPEQVAEILNIVTDGWIEIAQAQLAHIPKFAGGYSFSIENLWSRRPGGWLQDDALAYWSPTLYREFVRDCESVLSRSMASTGIHLHSPALFTVDDLVEMPDLDVIEINLDDSGARIPEMIPRFQQILAKKRLYIWGAFSTDDLLLLKENLSTRGLALQLMAATQEQVQEKVEEVKSIWRQ